MKRQSVNHRTNVAMAPVRRKCTFNAELARNYPFIKKNNSDSDVLCNTCGSMFNICNGGKTDIDKHVKSWKHKNALSSKSNVRPVTAYFASATDYTITACEGVWAYHIIKENHSFKSSDCASKVFRTCFEMHKFHCARTKCEAIAKNVFAPFARNELKNEIEKVQFVTVSSDASNHGNVKLMPVVIRFFIPTIGVKVKLLEFSSQRGETSEVIAQMIIETAEKHNIKQKIIGFCADNCRTNFGSRGRGGENNVFYRLLQWKPHLLGVGCAAHIVHNSLKHACDCLPLDIECAIVKIYSHFYINTVRIEELKDICDDIEIEYSRLLGYSKTRFLALAPAIGRVLKMFQPLQQYFLENRRCPTILRTFFVSPFSKLWLLFVKDQVNIDEGYLISNPFLISIRLCSIFSPGRLFQ